MKRAICICLASLALLMTACGREEEIPETSVPETQVQPAEAVETPVFQLESLPEIGDFELSAIRNRWYEDFTDHLILRKDYGPLVPYIGRNADALKWDGSRMTYGLATMDGKIVVDAVYDSVTFIDKGNGFYLLIYYDQRGVQPEKIDPDHPGKRGQQALITTDGSAMLEIPYDYSVIVSENRIYLRPDMYERDENSQPPAIRVLNHAFQTIWERTLRRTDGTIPTEFFVQGVLPDGGICYSIGSEGDDVEESVYLNRQGERIYPAKTAYCIGCIGKYMLTWDKNAEKSDLIDMQGNAFGGGTYQSWQRAETGNRYEETEYNYVIGRAADGYHVFDRDMKQIGGVFSFEPELVNLSGEMYACDLQESPNKFYKLETGEEFFTSVEALNALTRVDDVVLGRFIRTEGGLLDMATGKIVYATHKEFYAEETGDESLLLIRISDENKPGWVLLNTTTGKIVLQREDIEVRQAGGKTFLLTQNKGVAELLDYSQKTILLRTYCNE